MAEESAAGERGPWRRLPAWLTRPPAPGRVRPGLYAFEIVAWLALAAAVVFLRWQGLNVDWVTVDYTIPPLIAPTLKALASGVVLYAVYHLLRRRPPGDYLRQVFSLPWLLLGARLWLTCLVFTYAYFWLKVSVPLVNWRLWDRELWRLDVLLHAGFSPTVFLVELLAGTGLLPLLELWYSWWLPSTMFGLAFFCAYPDARTRRRFMLSTVLLWTLGAWLYVALPALGPAYVYPEEFAEVREEMPRAAGAQSMLMDNYQKVLAGRTGPLKRFNPTRGIAALPSLHVGGHWLLLLWVRRRARPLYLPAALGTALTFVGSIVTGWHYAVDGYAGIIVALAAYWTALAVDRRLGGEADAVED